MPMPDLPRPHRRGPRGPSRLYVPHRSRVDISSYSDHLDNGHRDHVDGAFGHKDRAGVRGDHNDSRPSGPQRSRQFPHTDHHGRAGPRTTSTAAIATITDQERGATATTRTSILDSDHLDNGHRDHSGRRLPRLDRHEHTPGPHRHRPQRSRRRRSTSTRTATAPRRTSIRIPTNIPTGSGLPGTPTSTRTRTSPTSIPATSISMATRGPRLPPITSTHTAIPAAVRDARRERRTTGCRTRLRAPADRRARRSCRSAPRWTTSAPRASACSTTRRGTRRRRSTARPRRSGSCAMAHAASTRSRAPWGIGDRRGQGGAAR